MNEESTRGFPIERPLKSLLPSMNLPKGELSISPEAGRFWTVLSM